MYPIHVFSPKWPHIYKQSFFFPFSNQGGYFYQPEDPDMYKIYFEKGPYL